MIWGRVLGIVTVLTLVALLGYGLTRDPSLIPSPLVGGLAPDFELEQLDAPGTVRLSELRGRVVVINFWASWCLACIQEHPSLARAWQRYRGREFELVGILYQDTPGNARRYLAEHGGGWTQLLDPGSRTALEFGVYGVPETFFIDRNGVITHKHIGPVNDSLLTMEIEKLLAGKAADPMGTGFLLQPAALRAGVWSGAGAAGEARGEGARAQEVGRSWQTGWAVERVFRFSVGGGTTVEPASGARGVAAAAAAGVLELSRLDTASLGQCRDCAVHRDIDALEREVASQLRCPVCQQLSILDSPSEMAREARKVIRERLEAGQTPEEIKAYFVSKYGEWILLSPRTSGFNLLVWVLPVLSFGVGAVVLGAALRRWLRAGGGGVGTGAEAPDELEAELKRAFQDLDAGA